MGSINLGRHAFTDSTFDQSRMDAVDNYRMQRGVNPAGGRSNIVPDVGTDLQAFNRYSTVLADDEASSSLGYVFMVRPDLNLSPDGHQLHAQVNADPFIGYMAQADPVIFLSLTHYSTTTYTGEIQNTNNHHFISFLFDRVEEYQVPDYEIGTHEMNQPFTGFRTIYAGNGNTNISGCQFAIGFRDTATLRVTKLFYLWISYINGISLNLFAPKEEYLYSKYTQGSQMIDYATSIYFIRTRPDGEIIFFHKITGVFPTSVPLNMQSFNKGSSPDPKVSVNFVGGYPEAMNPVTLGEFNYNATGGTFHVNDIAPDYDPLGYGGFSSTGETMVGAPFIVQRTSENGLPCRPKFYLCWQKLDWGAGNELSMPKL